MFECFPLNYEKKNFNKNYFKLRLIPVIKNILIIVEDKRKNNFTKLMMTREKQFGTLFKRLKNERNR